LALSLSVEEALDSVSNDLGDGLTVGHRDAFNLSDLISAEPNRQDGSAAPVLGSRDRRNVLTQFIFFGPQVIHCGAPSGTSRYGVCSPEKP
jgi:hypothetical protein